LLLLLLLLFVVCCLLFVVFVGDFMMKFVLFALCLVVVVFGEPQPKPFEKPPSQEGNTKEWAYSHIQDHLHGFGADENKDHCKDYPCCFLQNSTDGCAFTDFTTESSTLVFPGGKTKCIFGDSSDYAFQVWPGDNDKILIYFQGGGACWDHGSTTPTPFCTTSIYPQPEKGVFVRNDPDNKFSQYTIVHLLYCSGDLFAGNTTRPYTHGGEPVTQFGQENVHATYEWIKAQQEAGNFPAKFTDLVVMGQSAGSIGAQVWAGEILQFIGYEKASVNPDSYLGVFPPNSQGPLIYNFGACGAGNISALHIPDYLYQMCLNETLTLQNITAYWLSAFPDVPFGFIESKADTTQISFYSALAISIGDNPILTENEFYNRANAIMEMYNVYDNFVVYLVDGSQHTFTPNKLYYEAGPDGPRQKDPKTGQIMLDVWVPDFPLSSGDTAMTICDGKDEEDINPKYCDENLVGKTYTQP